LKTRQSRSSNFNKRKYFLIPLNSIMDCLPVPLGNYLLMATSRRTVKAIQIQRRIRRCQISIAIFALKKREYIYHSCAPGAGAALELENWTDISCP
jgi:hypothetical protein